MRLTTIRGRAHGRLVGADVAPLTVFAGPTGAGKTSTINLARYACAGWIIGSDDQPVKRPGDVSAAFGGDGVEATVVFDDGTTITRRAVVGRNGAVGTEIETSLAPQGANATTAQGAISAAVGDLAVLDVGALLRRTADERRSTLLGLCAAAAGSGGGPLRFAELARAATAEEYERVAARGDDPPTAEHWRILAETCGDPALADLAPAVDRVKRAALDAAAAAKRAAAKSQADRAAVGTRPEVAGTIDELRARLATHNQALGELRESSRRAAGTLIEIRTIETKLAALDLREPQEPTAAGEDVAALRERIGDLVRAQQEADERREVARAEGEATQPALDEARTRVALFGGRREALDAQLVTLRAAVEAGACPTCLRPCDRESVVGQLDDLADRISSATDARRRAAEDVEMYAGLLDEARAGWREHEERSRAARDELIQLRARLDAAQQRESQALVVAAERRARAQEAAALHGRLANLEVPASLELDTQAEKAAVAETQRQIDALEAYERAVAVARAGDVARLAAQHDETFWKAALVAARRVLLDLAAAATEPFGAAAAPCLPDGWTLRFDLETADLLLDRPTLTGAALSTLAQGERAIVLAAAAVGLARLAGVGWRGVIVDHAEALSNWPGEDGDGLFVRFVAGLRGAIDDGLIDQAVVAYNRLPQGDERARLDELATVVPFAEMPSEPEPAATAKPKASDDPLYPITVAVRRPGVGQDALRALCDEFASDIGATRRALTGTTLRHAARDVLRALVESRGNTVEWAVAEVDKYAVAYPPRQKGQK